MTDLLFDGATNIAGNYLIRFVPVVGVSSLPLPAASGPTAGLITSGPTFQDNYRWFTAYGTDFTKSVDEKQTETDNGPVWDIVIELFLPGDAPDRRVQLAELVRHRFLVAVEDNTGLKRLFGTLEEPLLLTYSFQVAKNPGDRRGYTLTFAGQLSRIAPAYTG